MMSYFRKGVVTALCLSMTGCYYKTKDYEPNRHEKLLLPSARSFGPEPVYSRLRWVHPPDLLPAREIPGSVDADLENVPNYRPVFQMVIKNGTLQEISRVLAATARYTSYCAPSISENKLTIESLGTIDELGQTVARKAGIKVVIDHTNHAVQFLASSENEPNLQDG